MMLRTMTFLDITGQSSVESILKLIGLIILCAIIIAASYFVTRFVGQKQMGVRGDSNFKSLDVYRINQTKYLQLIQIGTRYFVIAVCKDSVTMLAELSKDDIPHWKPEISSTSFKDILGKAMGSKTDKESDSATAGEKSEE